MVSTVAGLVTAVCRLLGAVSRRSRFTVAAHGGDVHVHSEPGDTRFEISLPLAAGEPAYGTMTES